MKLNYKNYIRQKLFAQPFFTWMLLLSFFFLAGCSTDGSKDQQKEKVLETKTGLASYYHRSLEGLETASGETFHQKEMVAAHPKFPLGTIVKVVNLENNKEVLVRINDRGPTIENRKEGVIIDLSQAAAKRLGMMKDGRVKVKVEVLEWGDKES